ncbi:MAG TPA: hypothetical protein VF420_11135 [Casimicrobiaceae bacterium]
MIRLLAIALFALASGASMGQMMGSPISTSQYFPLVDGARYDYMYTNGPWAASTAVMHAGQTWAGVSGLVALHTTYTCNVGVLCAPDATDFFRMDADGMHYFGGVGADATGSQFSMMSYSSPEWLLKSPVTPGTMMAGGGYQNMETWQAGVMGTGSMMGGQSYMSSYQALALETVSTPGGTFANCLHVREQRGNGLARDVWYAPGVGMVQMNDGINVAVLSGYTIPGGVPQPGGGAAPLAFTPVTGLWWNPSESGSGYNVEVQQDVLVVTVYSYSTSGDPLWYIVVGRMLNAGSGVAATGTLDKFRGGQCASCMYQPPAAMGNDGSITIDFSSPNSATLQLPGGRVTQIEPEVW